HLCYLIRDQTELRRVSPIVLIVKTNRVKSQDRFARAIHGLALFLEPGRRADCPELTRRIHSHRNGVGVLRLYVADVANETAVIHIVSGTSYSNDVPGRAYERSSVKTQGNIAAPGGRLKRINA